MPIYEYECEACGCSFEEMQKTNESSLKKCKKCGGGLKKIISKSSFLLKGDGWESDGYSKKKPTEKPKKNKGD